MPRILVVDDNAFMRNNIKNVLTGAGFDVVAELSLIHISEPTRPPL